MIAGVVLAAGAARRFGSPKQLAPLDGRPLLEHALRELAGACTLGVRLVVLGAAARDVLATVPLHGAAALIAPDWIEGQAASLRAAVALLAGAEAEAILVTLGDQPWISAAAIDRIVSARTPGQGPPALRASYGGRPAHPVLLERVLFDQLRALRGERGAAQLLARTGVREVACDGLGRPDDVDVPGELRSR